MEAIRVVTSAMWLQEPGSLSAGNSTLLMVFVAMVAVALSVQAIALIAMAVGAAKTRKQALEMAQEVRGKLMPLIADSQEFMRETMPKIRVMTDNFVETSHVVRSKAQEFDATASDLNQKTRDQAARVNGMVTSMLDTTTEITNTVQRGIRVPLREVSGLVNGLKAGLDVLVGRAKTFGNNGRVAEPVRDPETGWTSSRRF